MTSGLVVPPATARDQRRAADPTASAWVSANAGSGKTKVLTDRVIRLLLAGTPPSRILCLTFTKAAAANMTIRVFEQLGRWVTLDDLKLGETLAELTGERPPPALLKAARRLFARAIETPGGLKIETIHAFCERVLHLVPFEANVPARFAVLDESKTDELLALARGRVLIEAASGAPGREGLAAAMNVIGLDASGDTLTGLLDAAVRHEGVPSDPEELPLCIARLRHALGLAADEEAGDIRRAMLEDGIPAAEWPAIARELRRTRSSTDAKRADALDAATSGGTPEARLTPYLKVFFTEKGAPRTDKDLATRNVDPAIRARLEAERDRLALLKDKLASAEAVQRTEALFRLAGAIRAKVDDTKARLGALDFDDLIRKTLELLERDSAAWVLYKLDRGIDHVLVDEAQDTNPDQWRILRHLTEDFTAGEGRPVRGPRTLFAVGDPKQSIFSFQGADPRWFEDSRRHWRGRTEGARLRFEDVRLDLSFRSAPAILKAVDFTFSIEAHFRGLTFGDDVRTSHGSARPAAPGHVEIWPTQAKVEDGGEPDAWTIPVDEPDRKAPAILAAERVARAVRHWTRVGDEVGRIWRPGDILILVRKRGPAFFAAIRALKSAGIPVAGADRFDIGEQIAVNDLVAAGAAALLPSNDLVLAAALKSPLVGLDDDDLIRIAADRGPDESLVDALARAAEGGDKQAGAAIEAVSGWRRLARESGPFGFYAALLGPGGGRKRLVERLGGEAADAIDAFLCHAQAAETGPEAPSLTTFLARFESAEHTIKRDLDAAGHEVKVMTVHGAKGLEAPVVILLDGCDIGGRDPPFVPVQTAGNAGPVPVWSPGAATDSRALAAAREAAKRLRLEEHNRLLYVAMTRARDRLVIAPFTSDREPEEAWCSMVRRGFARAAEPLTEVDVGYGPTLIWSDGQASGDRSVGNAARPHAEPSEPDWLRRPVPPDPEPPPPLRPSSALGAAERMAAPARPRGAGMDARRRGILVHAVLDYVADLPADERAAAGRAFLRGRAPRLGPDERDALLADVIAVVEHPALLPLFGPGSRGEAMLAGQVASAAGTLHTVSGQVDRMAIDGDRVVVADFKSGAREAGAPLPAAYVAQIALYRALLADLHPEKRVGAMLVWTAGPEIVEPPTLELEAALEAALAAAQPRA